MSQRPKLVQEVITINRRCSTLFASANARSNRLYYRAKEKYFKMWVVCMDSRVDIPKVTQVPVGVGKHFRNLGARFNLEWEKFDEAVFRCYMHHLKEEGKGSLAMLNYHWSKGSKLRGCKGFNFDKDAAIAAMFGLQEQFKRVYGDNTESMIPLVVGLETDEDSLVFHGDKGEILDLGALSLHDFCSEEELKRWLQSEFRKIYPKKPSGAIGDLCFMGQKNLEHTAEVRGTQRPITDLDHKERVVVIGRGADSIYEANLALIVGMYSDEPEEAIREAIGVVQSNMQKGRINKDDGFVLLSTAAFGNENGLTFDRARERALGYRKLGMKIMQEHYSGMLEYMHPLTTVTNLDDRMFKIIE